MANDRQDHDLAAKERLHAKIRRILDEAAEVTELPDTWSPTSEGAGGSGQRMSCAVLGRAAMNQVESGPAAISRYEIWAGGAYSTLVRAIGYLDEGDTAAARAEVVGVASVLRAFAAIQRVLEEERRGAR